MDANIFSWFLPTGGGQFVNLVFGNTVIKIYKNALVRPLVASVIHANDCECLCVCDAN